MSINQARSCFTVKTDKKARANIDNVPGCFLRSNLVAECHSLVCEQQNCDEPKAHAARAYQS